MSTTPPFVFHYCREPSGRFIAHCAQFNVWLELDSVPELFEAIARSLRTLAPIVWETTPVEIIPMRLDEWEQRVVNPV